ncbi:MAG: molecular chaperone GrpE [bacterium F082]|nr:MAG: molecular chaperone GrpE [bacterium F082]KWW27835.1 MAG: molecular chaperone GrpE [bacterium P201]
MNQDTDIKQSAVSGHPDGETDNRRDQRPDAGRHAVRHQRKRRGGQCDIESGQVQQLGEKLAELNDKYLRTVAEYENYRKRTTLEKADLVLSGGKDILRAVLPSLDDLERALQAMTDDNAREGITMIHNKLLNALAQKGLKPMEARGARFDESLHEAVTQIPATDDNPKGTVVDVVEKGYFLHDKVLRYAKVVVAV